MERSLKDERYVTPMTYISLNAGECANG